MTDNRMSGLALIAGSAGLILTLSLHPSGPISPAQVEQMARKLIAVHSIGLFSLPFLFLGALGLSRTLAAPNRLGVVALVFYGFAITAMLCGVVADGLVTPSILRQIVAGGPSAGDGWRTIMRYNGYLDMSFVQVGMVASAVAIAMWSLAILRGTVLGRGVGVYGLILGVLAVAAVFSGFMGAEHAMSMVILGQVSWFIVIGGLLWRTEIA